jgi:hypothetical protein
VYCKSYAKKEIKTNHLNGNRRLASEDAALLDYSLKLFSDALADAR